MVTNDRIGIPVIETVNKPDTRMNCINANSIDKYAKQYNKKYSSSSSRFRKVEEVQTTKRHFWEKRNDQSSKEILDCGMNSLDNESKRCHTVITTESTNFITTSSGFELLSKRRQRGSI